VLFNVDAPLGDEFGFLIAEAWLALIFLGRQGSFCSFVRNPCCVDAGCLFAANATSNDGIRRINHGLENLDFVRIHPATDNALTEAIRSSYDDNVLETGVWIQGKSNTSRSEI
jgi:hypothetical protein